MVKKPQKPTLKIVGGSTSTLPQPPRTLREHGRELWDVVMSEYRIDDAGGIEVLQQICSALDRAEEMAAQIDNDGLTILVKGQLREHPLLKGEIALRSFVTRNLQRLGLNVEATKPVGRPPAF